MNTHIRTALLGMVIGAVLVMTVSPVQATTLLTESFDDGQTAVQGRWASSCIPMLGGPNWTLDTTTKFSGAAALKEVVDGDTTRTPEFLMDTCFFDRSYANTNTIYIRWYERTQAGFHYDASNTKSINVGPGASYPSWWIGHFNGDAVLVAGAQNVNEGGGNPLYGQNVSPLNTPTDTWQCIEMQFTMNTPGVGNGIFRIWVDSTLRGEYTAANFREAGNTSQFDFVRFYAQHGIGTRWFDELVIADARVGCIGGGGSGGGPIVMFITQSAIVLSTFLQVLFIGGYFWERRTAAVQAAVKFWRYAAQVPSPKEMYWAYRYKQAVKRWQKHAPLMLEHQPMTTIEMLKRDKRGTGVFYYDGKS